MKKTGIIILVAFLSACSSKNADTLKDKQALLNDKQKELGELKDEIKELKSEISALDTTQKPKDLTPVVVKTLSEESFNHYLQLTGTVTSEENILISAEASGRIESIPVNEGQRVQQGQVLMRIENNTVASQLQEAKSAFELAEITFNKRKNLWEKGIGSEIEYLQAKNNFEGSKSRYAQIQSQYNNTVIKSPISGSVDDIRVNEGEFVSVGNPIVRVVDLDNVEIEAEISEEYLPNVKKGDSVLVRIPALDIQMKAPVTFVSQVINPDNRSFEIQIKLRNKGGRIKPNVLANLMISDYSNDSALVVPSNVIKKDLTGDYVYIAVEENGVATVEKRYIKKGKSFGSDTEVKEGLSPQENVIVSGFNQVNEGAKVSIK